VLAAALAEAAGMLVAPGDLYGDPTSTHVRVAVVQPDDRLDLVAERLRVTDHPTLRRRRNLARMPDLPDLPDLLDLPDLPDLAHLQAAIEELWARSSDIAPGDPDALAIVTEAIGHLDDGSARVAEVDDVTGEVKVNLWLKHAILLLFRLMAIKTTEAGPFEYADKLPLKTGFADAGVRVVPGASARWGSFLERGVVMMPSYVNIGARVGADTMVDTWATVGSCAQIGARVHLSGGVGIGGVLEPPNAVPVTVGDDAFVGSRSMIIEGARVGEGAVVGAGTVLGPSIPVIDAETGEELSRGVIPPWCVAVSASRRREYPGGEFFLPCVLVVKRLDPGHRHDRAGLETMLREHGVAT
jgi:2,3,4,5-tetrahydropyridine-2-carboxylate N-succinyltransferase